MFLPHPTNTSEYCKLVLSSGTFCSMKQQLSVLVAILCMDAGEKEGRRGVEKDQGAA